MASEILCHPSLHRPRNPLTFICSFSDGPHHCQCSHWDLMWGVSYPDFLLFCAHRPRDPQIRLPSWLRNKKRLWICEVKALFLFPVGVKERQGEGCRVRCALSSTYVSVRDFLLQLTYVQNCAFLKKNLLSGLFLTKSAGNKCYLIYLFSI